MLGPSEGICENRPKVIVATAGRCLARPGRVTFPPQIRMESMEPIVTVVVLVSALIHAAWNAMVKGEEDALETQAAVVVGGAFFAVPFLFFVPFPNPEAGFYLALSAAIHCAYFAALAVGYRVGDLSFVYPIARGTGPILVALLSAFLIGEILPVPQLASVSIICFGLFGTRPDEWPAAVFGRSPLRSSSRRRSPLQLTDGIGVASQ